MKSGTQSNQCFQRPHLLHLWARLPLSEVSVEITLSTGAGLSRFTLAMRGLTKRETLLKRGLDPRNLLTRSTSSVGRQERQMNEEETRLTHSAAAGRARQWPGGRIKLELPSHTDGLLNSIYIFNQISLYVRSTVSVMAHQVRRLKSVRLRWQC